MLGAGMQAFWRSSSRLTATPALHKSARQWLPVTGTVCLAAAATAGGAALHLLLQTQQQASKLLLLRLCLHPNRTLTGPGDCFVVEQLGLVDVGSHILAAAFVPGSAGVPGFDAHTSLSADHGMMHLSGGDGLLHTHMTPSRWTYLYMVVRQDVCLEGCTSAAPSSLLVARSALDGHPPCQGAASSSAVCASSGTALLAATCQSERQLSLQRHELDRSSDSWQLADQADVALQTSLGLQPQLQCQLQLNSQKEASIWLGSQEPGRRMPCRLRLRSVCCRPWQYNCCRCVKEAEHHCTLLHRHRTCLDFQWDAPG